jgi:hypothetical protein
MVLSQKLGVKFYLNPRFIVDFILHEFCGTNAKVSYLGNAGKLISEEKVFEFNWRIMEGFQRRFGVFKIAIILVIFV